VRKEKGGDSVERGDVSSKEEQNAAENASTRHTAGEEVQQPALELLQNVTRCCSPGLVEEGGVLAVAAASGASYCGSLTSTQEVVVVVVQEEEEEVVG
jgi:hypothetical protein